MPRSPLATALVVTCLAASPAGAQLLHHYTFDGAAVVDVAGSANGTLVNGATVAGGVLSLDGLNDHVQFGGFLVPHAGDYSVALFVRQAGARQSQYVEFISQGTSSGPGFYVGYAPDGMVRVSDTWNATGFVFPDDQRRHHLALTVSTVGAGESRVYFDGALVATLGLPITTGLVGSATRLGQQYDPHVEFFRGELDDVRIYGHTLGAHEVAALAHVAAVPEPATWTLLAAGLGVLAAVARGRRRPT